MKLQDLEIQNGNYVIYEHAVELQEDYSDRKTDDVWRYASYDEAKEDAENVKHMPVGYSSVIYKLTIPMDVAKDIEYDDAEDFFEENIPEFDVEFLEHVKTEEGKNIEGSIIVKWQWNKYVGYSRNFVGVGIAGQYPYHNILKEIDLITGDEDRVFATNYSVLATKEELEEYGTEVLLRNMIEGDWRWNNVQDVSDTMARFVKEDLKDYTDRAMFNRVYQAYSLGKMVDEEGSITHDEFECIWKSRVYIREEYRDDLRTLIEKDILSEDILVDMLELDSQSAMDKLNSIKEKYER